MLDTRALAAPIATVVREVVAATVPLAVAAAVAPLLARIAELEARPVEPGKPGKDADPDAMRTMVAAAVAAVEIPLPKDGVSVDPDDVRRIVAEQVAALPPPAAGKDADPEAIRTMINEAVAAIELPQPRDPVDADMDQLRGWIIEAVAALPSPVDGKSVTIDDVTPMIQEAVAQAVAALPVPKDGTGLAAALIGRDGDLVVTLTDGSVRSLGNVVGRDYDPSALEAAVADAVAAIPPPKDGDPGKDADPLVIGQMVAEAAAQLPLPTNGKDAYPGEARGLFDAGAAYRALDVVSFNGSEWRAKRDDPGLLPGDGWMLSSQRGKPGKPGEPGKAGTAIVAAYVDAKALQLVLTRDDGSETKADLYELADLIRAGS